MYIYIYIYPEQPALEKRHMEGSERNMYICIVTHIYLSICIHIERAQPRAASHEKNMDGLESNVYICIVICIYICIYIYMYIYIYIYREREREQPTAASPGRKTHRTVRN